MSNYRNLDEITTVLKKRIATNKAFLEAWRAVNYPTKKDGTPFKTMSKNINGAKYKLEDYAMQPGKYELYIYTHTPETGYIHDYIKCYGYVDDIKSPEKLAKKENYQAKQQTYLKQVYTYDLEDIKEAVAKHMVYLTEQIINDEKQLEKLPEVFNSFNEAFKKIMQTLDEQTSEFNSNEHFNSSFIYNAVKDCVTERYPYI